MSHLKGTVVGPDGPSQKRPIPIQKLNLIGLFAGLAPAGSDAMRKAKKQFKLPFV